MIYSINKTLVAIATIVFLVPIACKATPFVAYPGTYPAKLVSVETPSTVNIKAYVWPGFSRVFRITIPGIDVPKDSPGASSCQRELAHKAQKFTENFLRNAKKIKVQELQMENTLSEDAVAILYTDKEELAQALIRMGYARSKNIKEDTPWC